MAEEVCGEERLAWIFVLESSKNDCQAEKTDEVIICAQSIYCAFFRFLVFMKNHFRYVTQKSLMNSN